MVEILLRHSGPILSHCPKTDSKVDLEFCSVDRGDQKGYGQIELCR